MLTVVGVVQFLASRHPVRLRWVRRLFEKRSVIRTHLVIIVCMLFWASYEVWREQAEKREGERNLFQELLKESVTDPKTPHLAADILSLIGMNSALSKPPATLFLTKARIVNAGAPSTVKKFSLDLKVGNETKHGIMLPINDDMHIPDGGMGFNALIRKEEALYSKVTHSAIQQGDAVDGWLLFRFDGERIMDYAHRPDVKFVLSLTDVHNSTTFKEQPGGQDTDESYLPGREPPIDTTPTKPKG